MDDHHIQLLRVKKLTGNGIIAIAARHNLREIQGERGADSHIDPRKSSLNIVLRGAEHSAGVAAEAATLMELAKAKRRKNEVLGLEVIFSLPPSSGISELEFFTDAVAWAEGFFEIPILSAAIHHDEAAPHCHIILLPLFDGRMIGNALVGNRARLVAMQADFHDKVGQRYGLKRGEPAKRYSRAARVTAADRMVRALQNARNKLDDPAIRDALRDAIAETMPVNLLALLGLDMPEVKTPKPKTFAGIMTKKFKPEKHYSVSRRENTIVFAAEISAQKEQTLCSVVFPKSAPSVQLEEAPLQDEFIREHETDQAANCWNEERGEFNRKPDRTKPKSAEVERVRQLIHGSGLPGRVARTGDINEGVTYE